jgi:hypothetical protein
MPSSPHGVKRKSALRWKGVPSGFRSPRSSSNRRQVPANALLVAQLSW